MIFPDLRALDTHIKAGALLPVYLLYGEENRQIEAARDRLVKTIVPEGDSMNLLRCDGSGGEVDWDGIADLLWSMSFTPGRKCAVVDDLNPSGLGSTGMSKLSELLAQPTEDGVLILTVRGSARQFAKKEAAATKLLNLCDKAGGVCRFAAMTRGDVGKFARQTALRLGCVLEPEEAALLADYCNLDSLRLRQEGEKLAATPARSSRRTSRRWWPLPWMRMYSSWGIRCCVGILTGLWQSWMICSFCRSGRKVFSPFLPCPLWITTGRPRYAGPE